MRHIMNVEGAKEREQRSRSNNISGGIEHHYSISDLSGQISVSKSLIREWIKRGVLEVIKINRRVLIPESSIRDLLTSNKVPKKHTDISSTIATSIMNAGSNNGEPQRRKAK